MAVIEKIKNSVRKFKNKYISAPAPSKDDSQNELTTRIKNLYELSKRHKTKYVRQWRMNEAFVKDYHWVDFKSNSDELYVPPRAKSDQVRMVENHIQEIYLTLLSILTSGKPSVFLAPHSSELKDIQDARAQQSLADFLWDDLKLNELLQEAVAFGLIKNRMIFKVFWNSHKGDPITVPRDAEQIASMVEQIIQTEGVEKIANDEGLPRDVFYEEIQTGYLDAYAVNPDSFYVEPHVKKWSEIRRCIETHIYHKDDAKELWDFGDNFQGGNISSYQLSDISDVFADVYGGVYGKTSAEEKKDLVLIMEYFELPSKEYPEGRWAVIFEEKILDYKESCTRLPYISRQLILDNTSFWGEIGKIKSTIPIQVELNKTVSQIIEEKNINIHPPIFFPLGCGIDKEEYDDAPHKFIDLTRKDLVPFPMQRNPITADMYSFPDQLRIMMENVSGIHGITKGQTEASLASGRAISFMAEKDQQKFAHPARNIENLYCDFMVECMKLWKNHMPIEKTITVMGKDMAWESVSFHSNQIKSYNVFIRPYSMLMSTRAMQNDVILQLIQSTAIPPEQGLKLLEFGNLHLLWGDQDTDTAWAKQENVLMIGGQIPTVNWWENHIIHYKTHTDFMKTTDYQLLDETIKVGIQSHAKAHVMYMQQAAQQQAGMQGGEGESQVRATAEQGYNIGAAGGKTTEDIREEDVLKTRGGI